MSTTTTVLGDLDTLARDASDVARDDLAVTLDGAEDAPTSVPCGITISITLDC